MGAGGASTHPLSSGNRDHAKPQSQVVTKGVTELGGQEDDFPTPALPPPGNIMPLPESASSRTSAAIQGPTLLGNHAPSSAMNKNLMSVGQKTQQTQGGEPPSPLVHLQLQKNHSNNEMERSANTLSRKSKNNL